ncbi:histone H2B-like [Hibiscus syriacus]|uniref:Histone H2B-like n=1 Tax=Hibiscus syriacus TaxID=106335 RepID=A0A6A3D2U1_HIBSY|nr:histone H2B-like [Hibiscus syriacus]
MGSFEQFKGTGQVNDQTMGEAGTINPRAQWNQMGYEGKTAAIHEEMKRMNRLPATSSYVTHHMRVLNKILQLLSIQRTASQEEELDLLFSGMSL